MVPLTVIISDEEFDRVQREFDVLPDTDIAPQIIVKEKGTLKGKPIAMICFPVVLPDGSVRWAQTVTTVSLLKTALRILESHPATRDA